MGFLKSSSITPNKYGAFCEESSVCPVDRPAGTPPNSLIETFTAVDTPRLLNGLGWNVTLGNEWEWDKVKLARGREVRVQFGWETVESASSGVLSLTTNFQNALS